MSLISFNFARPKPLPAIDACVCNSGDVEIQEVRGRWRVICRLCDHRGTAEATKEDAIRWWNHVNK